MPERRIGMEKCEEIGGHCWKGTGMRFASYPPQHPEVCKHCGATRVGRLRDAVEYSEIRPPGEPQVDASP